MESVYIKKLDIKVKIGELICIIGPNGCGKTTLLKMICGKINNDILYINDKDISLYDIEFKKNNIVCVFNDNLYKTDNPLNEMEYYLKILGFDSNEIKKRIDNFCNYFKLDEIITMKFIDMSVKDRIYIKILSLLIILPKLICIDDLLTYLDIKMKKKIINYIRENNIIMFGVTSNVEEICLYDKLLIMSKGKKILFDDINEVLSKEEVFNRIGYKLPFINDINNLLKSYELISENHLVYKELVDVLWK